MEPLCRFLDAEPDTKVARTDVASMARDLIGSVESKKLLHIAGIFKGHDVDGTPLEQSGKLIVPASGKVKNLILVSHYTIGANFECPSETFPLEGIFAAKGYAVAIADYIGFGVTADRIHPYMHTESTARSVVDMGLAVKPGLLEGYNDWINSKAYTVGQINRHIGSSHIDDIMTDEGRDKNSPETARLYTALLANSVLNFVPWAPIYLFHSSEDGTVPFVNGQRAEQYFKGYNLKIDFGKYGSHQSGSSRREEDRFFCRFRLPQGDKDRQSPFPQPGDRVQAAPFPGPPQIPRNPRRSAV